METLAQKAQLTLEPSMNHASTQGAQTGLSASRNSERYIT